MRTFQRIGRWVRPWAVLPLLSALGLAGFVMLAHGCGPDNRMPEVSVNPRLPDVPVPFGFKFEVDRSTDRVIGTARTAEHLYSGDTSVAQTTQFYRLHMSTYGWTLKDQSLSAGRQRFMYEKGPDTCYVSVWDDWGTKLLINVMQKGAGPVEPPFKAPPVRPAAK
jgi:hypothetical protein